MNWNAKPGSVTLPPQYPKKQASFLEQGLVNTLTTTSQSSFHTGSNQEPCLFLSNSHPVSQPLLNIRNHQTPPQTPISDLHSGTIVTSQTSVERITYANVKGPKQLSHDLQISSGVTQDVWLNSPMGSSTLSHTGATVSHQTGFGTNKPNVHALQNQFLTSDTYSMQLHMIPSNSGKVPITYQGNPRLNLPLAEQQVDWAPQRASSGLTYQDYRPLPKQYNYSSQSFLQEPTVQKQNPMSSVSFQVKNSQSSNPSLTFKSKQIAAVPSYQYAVTQTDKRPPPYDCRYTSQSLQSTARVVKQSSVEVPQSQEMHLPEMRKDFCRDFQQQWQNLNENFSMMESSCNLKVNTSVSHPFNEPVRSSVTGTQALAQNNQEKRVDSQTLTSNQVLDTSVTKEKLVRDIKTLVEIKKKFSDLARKIKINKNLLMAAGCIKTPNTSYSESAQNSGLSLKQTAKMQSGPQLTLVTPETVEDKPPTVMESAEETNRTHSVLSSNLHNRNFNQISSVLLNSACSEKLPIPEQVHGLEVVNPLKTSTVEVTQAPLNNTQLSSGNFVSIAQNVPRNSEITFLPHSISSEEYISKYPNKNRLILSLLTSGDKTQKKLLKETSECIHDSKLHNFEMNPNTKNTGNQLKTMETVNPPRTCNINAKIADSSCFECKSFNGVSSNSGSHFSVELLATCLSLWKKQPSEPTKEKQGNESKTNTTAIAISNPVPVCESSPFSPVGNSQNKIVNSSQETISSVVAQNYESSGTTATKGIAVVSPLILSDVNTLSVKDTTSEALPETVYPVIKEGSVCSLQNKLTENTAALKINVNEQVTSTTGITIFPLIENKQSESTNTNSEGIPNTNQGKHSESEPDIQCPVSDQQASYISKDSSSLGSDVLQIGSICSLVEGDTSYDSQIAEIFNLLPLQQVEPQKPLPNHQMMNSRQQNEHLEDITENKDFDFKKDEFVQCTDVSNKITDQSESLQPPALSPLKYVEAKSRILEESSLEHITENESMAIDMCSSAAIQQDSYPQEADLSCSYTEQDPKTDESLNDKTSILYLHDQLSELLKEFPYGIEPVNMHESSVVQQMADQISEAQTCKTDCDSKGSTDQIKITILNTDQMKELFPEQDDQPNEVDKLTEPQKEKPVTKEENQCDPQAHRVEHCDSVPLDSEKDDIRCCALGWLSMVYEGVPQCQCNAIKKSTSKEKKQTNPCSPSEPKSYKQGERTSDRDVPVAFNSPPNNPPKIPLTCPVEKKHFPETKQSSNIKDKSKIEHNSSLRTEQELSSQLLSKGDKKLDSLQSHKRKRNLQFHEVTFHSANKITKLSQESLQTKFMAQNLRPLKPKMSFLTSKTKDLNMKNGSLVQSVSPEKRKLKSGGSKQKSSEERKLDEGIILDSEIKRKKHHKQEKNKNVGGGAFKFCNFSIPNERAWIKEKTVSNVKSSGSKDNSSKMNRVLSPKEYLSRQKHKEALKKNYLKNSDSQYVRPSKLSVQVESSGKSNERPNGSVQTCKESLNTGTGHGKSIKTHHSKESKTYISRNIKGTVGGNQPDKMWIDRTKLDKNLNNINNEGELSQMPSQTKDQRKLYLNRVAFKCTERERICLTKLDNSPRKLKEKRPESKSKNLLPVKDTTEKLSMLEFKLCPDGVFKNTNTVEDQKDLQHTHRKEQAPVQVSGMKSTKEDWLKCVTEEKRMPEANQEIDDNVLANSRLSKRNCSADGFEILQNPIKDSKAMFQTYKKLYMEKRSRSLGSSPLE
ncbi:retroelement silencing factor 1 isoform X1 [Moschus berezovskii]|uniref:retroelement silencing factor 1 isoform X1 n=1 Tax=Moschus berezovskii TaxID=68408 RepID=UPI002443C361|nr:retroelement silencing factor 1 isoform X1 [Moschus berezovskii]XP_055250060.1 retroelement silencing factor 1 isoform X1 [Moschus berezovskii]XP_055250061.1 retroelement silencing factor 1 isoform X1 [Moschus berezovskii]